jgi:CheY-like chemotaxis protein
MNKTITILVADDDEHDLRMTLEALLQRNGRAPTVIAVHDGAEALDFLHGRGAFKSRSPGNPQFLLLDLNMPRLDGWEVLRQIRADAALRTMPVVIFTSSGRDRDVQECYDLGANAYVVKPIDFTEFSNAIRDIQMFWTDRNEPPPASAKPILAIVG